MIAAYATEAEIETVDLHGVRVEIEVVRAMGRPAAPTFGFAHLHRDELTALAAARQVLAERGGHLVTLPGERERRLSFELSGQRHSFDPNRSFTARGRAMTLEPAGTRLAEATAVVEGFALKYLAALGGGPIVAVHNNSPGPPLSIRSFVAGAADARVAADVYVADDRTEDDFALVTHPALFAGFRAAGFNVVLQSMDAPDDGSLSVYCALRGIPYVNIEALDAHFDEQCQLIRVAQDLLAGLGAGTLP